MEENAFAKTTLERMPPEFRGGKPKRTSVWIMLVIIVVLLIGGYLLYAHIQGARQIASETEDRASTPSVQPVDDLQAAVNIAIPDFSKNF